MKFETFITLSSNEKALLAAKNKVSEILLNKKSEKSANRIEPLLISTERPGLGSTHLLKSIESELVDMSVILTYGERFLYPYAGDLKQYCRYLKTGKVLLLEDIQHLFQEEINLENCSFDSCGSYGLDNQYIQQAYKDLSDVVTSYYQQGKAVIATTTESCSKQTKMLLQKSVSCLAANKVIIQRLTYIEKLILLHEWQSRKNLEFLTNGLIDEIVNNVEDDVRSLEGCLKKLLAERKLRNEG